MKVLLIGASGAIGKIITPALRQNHQLITAGRNSGDVKVDISSSASIENLFRHVNNIDAIICAAGESVTTELASMTEEKFAIGIRQKFLAQINLVLIGSGYLNNTGSFTLTSGKMGDRPALASSGKAAINGGINSFVLSASLEMPRGIRINAVSPAKIETVPDEDLVAAYLKSIENPCNGEIIPVGYN